jgi:Fic family protein
VQLINLADLIIVSLVAKISEKLGQLSVLKTQENNLYLRRINRIRTIQGSLAIEGNTLTEMQITAVLDFFAFHDTYTSVSILPHIINQTLHQSLMRS